MSIKVVTGANRGIGLALAQLYLEKSDTVYAGVRTPAEAQRLQELAKEHKRLRILPLDVTSESSITNFKYAIDGAIDTLIHCAGIFGPKAPAGPGMEEFAGQPIDEITRSEWLNIFDVNTISPFMVTRALRSKFTRNAKVVLISSLLGSLAFNTNGMSYIYNSSKAALNMVGRSLAVDLGEQGTSVCMIHPGWVKTNMGGKNAEITPEQSAVGVHQVISDLCLDTSGQFFDYDGSAMDW